jgi:hypothetical protein
MRAQKFRRSQPAKLFAAQPRQWTQNSMGRRANPEVRSQNAQRSYERYLALAEAETRAGNSIAAENYYQHAEHYYRVMSSDSAG